jgi:hypothetical protein
VQRGRLIRCPPATLLPSKSEPLLSHTLLRSPSVKCTIIKNLSRASAAIRSGHSDFSEGNDRLRLLVIFRGCPGDLQQAKAQTESAGTMTLPIRVRCLSETGAEFGSRGIDAVPIFYYYNDMGRVTETFRAAVTSFGALVRAAAAGLASSCRSIGISRPPS